MLETAQKYEKAFERYSDEDPCYSLELEGENDPGVPTKSDWEKARKMSEFLKHFYDLTLRVSATSHPTSHTYFHEIADVLVLLRQWCKSEDTLRKEMGERMLVKYYKYWGEKYGERLGDREKRGEKDKGDQLLNIVIFFCVAVDPRFKLSSYVKLATKVMFGDEVGEKLWGTVDTCFRALFEEYRELYAPAPSDKVPSEANETPAVSFGLMSSIIAQQMSNNMGGSGTVKSELDKNLSEDREDPAKAIDILSWWKDNAARFPIISRMARDLLAIPISTVASESAVSAGGRTLDDFRTSLTPTMVERLVCTNDWLRGNYYEPVEEDIEALAKLEEDMGALAISKD